LPQTASESAESEWLIPWERAARRVYNWTDRLAFYKFPWIPGAEKHRSQLRTFLTDIEGALRKQGKLEKGYIVRMDGSLGLPQRVRDDGKNFLYTKPPGHWAIPFDSKRRKRYK